MFLLLNGMYGYGEFLGGNQKWRDEMAKYIGKEYIGAATHEQYSYPDYHLYQPDSAEKLMTMDKVEILTHRYPDGDTLGSAYALCSALQQLLVRCYGGWECGKGRQHRVCHHSCRPCQHCRSQPDSG